MATVKRNGLDAPIMAVVEGIVEQSGTPYFAFKDLDENKPSGSIKIRVETIDYFLKRFAMGLVSPTELLETQRREFGHDRPRPADRIGDSSPLIQLQVKTMG